MSGPSERWQQVERALDWVLERPYLLVPALVGLALLLTWATGGFEDRPCWTAPCHLAQQTSRGMEYVETRCVVCRPGAGGRP